MQTVANGRIKGWSYLVLVVVYVLHGGPLEITLLKQVDVRRLGRVLILKLEKKVHMQNKVSDVPFCRASIR